MKILKHTLIAVVGLPAAAVAITALVNIRDAAPSIELQAAQARQSPRAGDGNNAYFYLPGFSAPPGAKPAGARVSVRQHNDQVDGDYRHLSLAELETGLKGLSLNGDPEDLRAAGQDTDTAPGIGAQMDTDIERAWRNCEAISFDPLAYDVPSCDWLVDSGLLDAAQLINALLARSRAYILAMTYKGDHDVTEEQLWAYVLEDTEREVALARELDARDPVRLEHALEKRADARWMTGDLDGARHDYTEALATVGDETAFLLGSRARVHAAMGRYDEAVADMSAAIRIAPVTGRSNLHNWLYQRGEMHEAAGNVDAAVADYRRTLATDPEHGRAKQALKRLGAERGS